MNLTHFSMTNEELNGHEIFGLTNPMIKTLFHYEQTGKISMKKKSHSKKRCLPNSRLNIYQRKSSQHPRFHSLVNLDYLLNTFDMDSVLVYAR